MIGNDVIDIKQSREESNWQRKGFIEKIYTREEQLLISNASNPEFMVWILWSMKEAAYKIYNRQTKVREYIPKKLICFIELHNKNFIIGKVSCNGNMYYTKTTLSKDEIHTVAVSNLEDLKKVTEIEKKSILKDSDNIPYLDSSLQNTIRDVSVSHHGRFEKVVTITAF
ncbi:4'-phosphopantetheinyl transferase superfamily protein [Flavobacterium sp. KJJ]|uniref:4'-phosphopantetheinyl transferase family protein n=1 Tax=Flavobacterium sp. KJJ TaxID=1270193 RepID=UPI0004935048|nr:4'-phosphopantetheinyl transferase superfamily protein [Flavobacterium sp. KJJ]